MPRPATSNTGKRAPATWAHGLRDGLMYGGLPVAGVAVALLLGTAALYGLPPRMPLLGLAFFGTFLLYLFERAVLDVPEDQFNHPARQQWFRARRRYVWGAVALAGVGCLLCLPFVRPATWLVGGGLGAVGVLYATPLPLVGRRLKTIWYLKPLLIAGTWAAGAVALPLVEAGLPVAGGAWALMAYRGAFILPNALLADWADRHGDARAGLRTVGTEWGARRVRAVAAAALGLALGGGLVALGWFGAPALLWADLVGVALMLAVVLRPWPQDRFFYSFLLDLLIGWPVVTALVGA